MNDLLLFLPPHFRFAHSFHSFMHVDENGETKIVTQSLETQARILPMM